MAANSNLITVGGTFRILYLDHTGDVTERCIRPERIFTHERTGNRLIVAWCFRRETYRTFDAARILWVAETVDTGTRTFGMVDAVNRLDADGFHVAVEGMRAA